MPDIKNNIKVIYNTLAKEGYNDLGSEQEFAESMTDENNRKLVYNTLKGKEFADVKDYDSFSNMVYQQPRAGQQQEEEMKPVKPAKIDPRFVATNVGKPTDAQPIMKSVQQDTGFAAPQDYNSQNAFLSNVDKDYNVASHIPDAQQPIKMYGADSNLGEVIDNLYTVYDEAYKKDNPKKIAEAANMARSMGLDNEQAEKALTLVHGLYSQNVANNIADYMYSRMNNGDPLYALKEVYYNKDFQKKLKDTTTRLGLDNTQGFVEYYLKPALQRKLENERGFTDTVNFGVQSGSDDVAKNTEVFEKRKAEEDLLQKQVDAMNAEGKRIEEKGQQMYDPNYKDRPWWADLIPVEGGGRSAYDEAEGIKRNPEAEELMRTGQAMQRMSDDAQAAISEDNILRTRKTDGLANQIKNAFGRILRGGAKTATDIRTWDFGFTDLKDATVIKAAADAYANNRATAAQKALLNGVALKNAVMGKHGDSLGGLYGAAGTTIQMVPFMAQFAFSPVKGVGPAAQKYCRTQLEKAFGKYATEAVGKFVIKSGELAGRFVGDVAQGAAMTTIFNMPAVAADTHKRMTGDLEAATDSKGNIVYSGKRTNVKSGGRAFAEAFTAQTIENQSELVGEYFAPLQDFIQKGAIKALDKWGLSKTKDFLTGINNKQIMKSFNRFTKNTEWNGLFGEVGEEIVGNFENAFTVGDLNLNLDINDDNSVFSKKVNTDIILGVGLGCGIISGARVGSYIRNNRKLNTAINDADTHADVIFGTDRWQQIKSEIDNAPDDKAGNLLQSYINNAKLNNEQKQTIVDYTVNTYIKRGNDISHLKNAIEDNISSEQQEVQSAYENGQNARDAQMNEVKTSLDEAEKHAAEVLGEDELNALDSVEDVDAFKESNAYKSYSEEQRETALKYIIARTAYNGMINRVQDEIKAAVNKTNAEIDNLTHKDSGTIIRATLKNGDQEVYVVSGNVVMSPDGKSIDTEKSDNDIVVYNTESGKKEMLNIKDLQSVDTPIDAATYKANNAAETTQQIAETEAAKIDGTRSFHYNDTVKVQDKEGNLIDGSVQDITPDGVIVVSDAYPGGKTYTAEELTAMQPQQQTVAENATVEQQAEEAVADNESNEAPAEEKGEVNSPQSEATSQEETAEPQQQAIPTDNKGNLLYHEVPVERTIEDLYDGSLDDTEIADFISANIEAAQKEYNSVVKKAPKIGTDKARYLQEKKAYQAETDKAKAKVDYWQAVENERQRITHTSPEELKNAEDELSGEAARKDYRGITAGDEENPTSVEDLVRDFLRGAKITPEDFRKETGLSISEQKKFVGMISKQGKTIARLGEELADYDAMNLGGRFFDGDSNAARGAIIDALLSSRTRGDFKEQDATAEEERYIEAVEQQREQWYYENYHMTYEEYLQYREIVLPELLRKYANFAPDILYPQFVASFEDAYVAEHSQTNNTENNEQQRNDTTTEEPTTTPGNTVLQTEETNNSRGDSQSEEQPTEVPTGVRSSNENGTLPQSTPTEVDKEPLSEEAAQSLITSMEENAIEDPEIRLTPQTWLETFGINNSIDTPIGKVRMGENQYAKLQDKKRTSEFGMISLTLSDPDVIFVEPSKAKGEDVAERNFSYVFAKTFKRNGNKVKYYTSVTVSIDGLEISVSSHFVNPNKMLNKLMEFNREYTKETLFSNSSEMRLAEHQSDVPDLLPTQENNVSSDSKVTQSSQTKQEKENKFSPTPRKDGESITDYAERVAEEHKAQRTRKEEEAKVDTNPTDAQKEAGNYKKGHIKVDGLNITIEQPKGSIRRGTDANGKQWESEMHNTYGYIRGTESVDGDHIDIFLSDNPTAGNVFVVDQINKDGSFDEHKVMYGFPDMESAKRAYLSNYEEGWQGLGNITEVSKEDFKAWIDSSKRKTKPFAEYTSVKTQDDTQTKNPTEAELRERKKQELRNKIKAKLRGQLNVGVDPELFMMGVELASMEIEDGVRKFADFTKKMIAEIGDEIRPYLKSIYNGARDLPGMEELSEEMTPYEEVKAFNIATIGKETEDVKPSVLDTAEQISNEQAVEHSAKEELKNTVETQDVDNEAYSITKQHNNKKDIDIWVVRGKERTDSDAFKERKQVAKKHNGYYSSFRGVNGFVFNSPEDAQSFVDKVFDAKDEKINTGTNENYAHNSEEIMHKDEEPDKTETTPHGLKIGDKVLYKEKEATIFDFDNGRPVLDTGLAPVVYEVVDMDAVKPIEKQEQTKTNVKEDLTEEKTEAKAKEANNKTVSSHAEGNLFDTVVPTESLTNKEKENEVHLSNGETATKRERGHEPRQNEPMGESKQNEAQRPDGRRMDRRDTAHISTDTERGGGVPNVSEGKQRLNSNNNHGERGVDYAPTSIDARIEANIQAIELAKKLTENGEKATPQQMEILRKFSGWGGLGKAFNENPNGAYGEINKTPRILKELLGEEAYNNAIESANSSYYTPTHIIDTLWDIAEKLGFKGGRILEGSAGIGNIIAQIPTHISENSNIHAVEKDPTAGSILSLLYPDAKVDIQGFEETSIPNGSIDLAITNVPFVTGLRVWDTTSDKDLSKKFHDIHNFCIAKNIRKLREGGIGIFISSNGTLDNSQQIRNWVVNDGNADFIGAFRLNNKTFLGTSVTSDIIVVRKRVNGKKSAKAIDVSEVSGERIAEFNTGEVKKVKGKMIPVIKDLPMDYNKYFIEHPEKMAGVMEFAFEHGDTYRPTTKQLYPTKDKPQDKLLEEFVNSFSIDTEEQAQNIDNEQGINNSIYEELGSDVKEGSMVVSNGELCVAQYGQAVPLKLNANKVKGRTKQECFKSYTDIKQALNDVLAYETQNADDKGLQPLLDKLNKAYDDFVNTYGHLNKNTSISFLRNDIDFSNILALETYKEENDENNNRVKVYGKTDVFSKRVVTKETEPKPDNVKDGVIVSIYKNGRIDIPYISKQLNMSEDAVKNEIINSGLGFENPVSKEIEVSYKYLSGNVREKLQQAEENNENGEYSNNINALKKVIPANIPAHLIEFNLGSSWVTPKLYEEYIKNKTGLDVTLIPVDGTWVMKAPLYGLAIEQNRSMGVYSKLKGETILGHELIEAAIQNKTITISKTRKDWDGKKETIVDKDATQACNSRIDEIRQDFKDWARGKVQSDVELSQELEKIYNDKFNNYVAPTIPEEFIPERFGGAAQNIKLRPHQAQAVVRGTTQPLILAHEVGTGKTFTLISTAMEMRRLGTARKPMIVVQNATVGQFVASAKALYPNAKILTLENSDRGEDGRRRFYAKIRYNDWDMIVVPQSTFEFIPDSKDRQITFIKDKVDEKLAVLQRMKEANNEGDDFITRRVEKEISQLQSEIAALIENNESEQREKKATASELKKKEVAKKNTEAKAKEMLDRRTDDVEDFDELGIDALLVDEAHEYKHLGFATAMQRGVKGVDPSYSKKAQSVFLKTQAVLSKNNGRNVIFATGTPISNTAAEIWTFMRYLMPADTMKEYGIYYFDDFVRNFGNIQQMLEFTTSGKFKENNRFAGYINLPELARIWSSVADIVLTRDQKKLKEKIPEIEGGKAQDIYLPQTKSLRSVMKYVKDQLTIFENMSGAEKKENTHIPLTMYGIAKAAAVDARLVDAIAEDDVNSKTNEAVRQTLQSLKDTNGYKGTVAIFADVYQNKAFGFNLYEDIKKKLIEKGVPEKEIFVMKPGMTINKKLEIFNKVNSGEIRVILGSTFTLGTGVNIQERLHTLIHLDAPNRPMDYTQRNGRILRQGNIHKEMNKPVRILRFGVEDSLDVTAYQRLKTKGAIADSIMNSKQLIENSMENRELEEEADLFGDTVAQLSGSEYAMLKNQAEKEVRKYESKKRQWEADQTYIHNAKPRLKGQISKAEQLLEDNNASLKAVKETFPNGKFNQITIGKQQFDSIEAMTDFIKDYNKKINEESNKLKEKANANYNSQMVVNIDGLEFTIHLELAKETANKGVSLFSKVTRKMYYSQNELGLKNVPIKQGLLRNGIEDILNNVITGHDFAERIDTLKQSIAQYKSDLELILARDGKPFEFKNELETAKQKLEEYTEAMKEELEEKEKKYAAMDSEIKTATNIIGAEEAEDEDSTESKDTKDDILYRTVFGGNSGYVGYSMSKRAAEAKEEGRYPKTEFKKEYHITEKSLDMLTRLGFIDNSEWHHTSMYGNKTPFYGWTEDEFADDYLKHKKEVDTLCKGFDPKTKQPLIEKVEKPQYEHEYEMPQYGEAETAANPIREWRHKQIEKYDQFTGFKGYADATEEEKKERDAYLHSLNEQMKEKIREMLAKDYPDYLAAKNALDAYNNYEEDLRKAIGERIKEYLDIDKYSQRWREQTATTQPTANTETLTNHAESVVQNLHLNNVEIVPDGSSLNGEQATAKGFYNKRTGKIVVVVSNHTDIADIEKTVLHEAVAHHGLRELFGDNFDNFLDTVFAKADIETRQQIAHLSAKHGWNIRTATEEYLAGMAEDANFEQLKPTTWQRIKRLFGEMMSALGLHHSDVTDNDLRYLLWRSYKNLENGGKRSILDMAEDIAMQYRLKVGNYTDKFTDELNAVNERFNEKLSNLTEENADKVALNLGTPSAILRAAGVENKPMKLYGNKVIKKIKKHGFALEELKDLPKAVANPIAVFNNYKKEGNRSILTELKTKQGNFLVTIDLGKGTEDIDFNIVSSVFGKDSGNIVDWIERGLAVYINKEKALNYLHHSALRAEALSSSRLNSAAKIIKDFHNPKLNSNVLYRSSIDPTATEVLPDARTRYEEETKEPDNIDSVPKTHNFFRRFYKSYVDSMLALKSFTNSVLEATGDKMASHEDTYKAENAMTSKNKTDGEVYNRDYYNPLLTAAQQLCEAVGMDYDALNMYMVAKHGLERNEYMGKRAAQNDENVLKAKKTLEDAQVAYNENPTSKNEAAIQKAQEKYSKVYDKALEVHTSRDYSGLTELTGKEDVAEAEYEAQKIVDAVETSDVMPKVTAFWSKVNAATKQTLKTGYESGIMTKDTYEHILNMYKYYIPLRGWAEPTADDVYTYYNNRSYEGKPLTKTAKGRTSLAEDPMAIIASMAQRSIIEANRNKMKQTFLNFVLNHPTSLATVGEQWYIKNALGEWERSDANIPANATPDEISKLVAEHEQEMQTLAETGEAIKQRNGLKLDKRVINGEGAEHTIKVWRGGKEYIIYINGNPAVAQAVNGLTNPDTQGSDLPKWAKIGAAQLKNFLSGVYTSFSPAFVLTNFTRDQLFASQAVYIKYGLKYKRQASKNARNLFFSGALPRLVYKWEHGTLDLNNETERYFDEFMRGGGETGFTALRDIESIKKEVKDAINGNKANIAKRGWKSFINAVEFANRSAEDFSRFVTFMTSRQQGKNIVDSIYDAKDITVNFNKKGSGEMGSRFMNFAYIFFNAAVQSINNFGTMLKQHPARTMLIISKFGALGFGVPMLNAFLTALCGGGDDDKYWDNMDWVRRNNIVLRIPFLEKTFISIPLPQELRPFYGMGEIAASILFGKETFSSGLQKAVEGFTGLLPIDFTGNGGNLSITLTPTVLQPVAQYMFNTDYFGRKVYNDNEKEKFAPGWTKAFSSTPPVLIEATKFLNSLTGGNDVDSGGVNLNPDVINHFVKGYFGGPATFVTQMSSLLYKGFSGDAKEIRWRDVPVASRFVQQLDERSVRSSAQGSYKDFKEETEETEYRLSNYKKQVKMGKMEYAKMITDLIKSPEYQRYKIAKAYKKPMDLLKEALNHIDNTTDKKEVEKALTGLRHYMMETVESEQKGKHAKREEDFNYLGDNLSELNNNLKSSLRSLKRNEEQRLDGEEDDGIEELISEDKETTMRIIREMNKLFKKK